MGNRVPTYPNSNIGNLEVWITPFREIAAFDLSNRPRVCMHGFFLEIADEAVHNTGVQKVGHEEGVEEDALRTNDHELHEPAGLAHLHEREEMHSLVVALFEECLDPAVVALHPAKTAEVTEHTADHARDAGNAFEEDESDELYGS